MARLATFTTDDFLESAAVLIAEGGPAAATTAAILHRVGASAGSFYYRFASRDRLLGELWLGLVERYKREFFSLLQAGDVISAALFTPRWARQHPTEARILLLHRREDFVYEKWPAEFVKRAGRIAAEQKEGLRGFTATIYGTCSKDALRRVQFALIDVPLTAVRRHLVSNEPVPLVVDDLVRECCTALIPCTVWPDKPHKKGEHCE